MGTETVALIFIGLLIVILFFARLEHEATKRRRANLQQFANSKSWDFYPEGLEGGVGPSFFERLFVIKESDEVQFIDHFSQFEPFRTGHSKDIRNLITGTENSIDWYVFDYSYLVTTSSGKSASTTTYRFSVVATRIPVKLPALSLNPPGPFSSFAKILGMQDIQFESEEFNKKYVVQCESEQTAFHLLHPQMIEFFLRTEARSWQMAGPFLLLYYRNLADPFELGKMMFEMQQFVRHIPPYFHQDHGFERPWEESLDGLGLSHLDTYRQ